MGRSVISQKRFKKVSAVLERKFHKACYYESRKWRFFGSTINIPGPLATQFYEICVLVSALIVCTLNLSGCCFKADPSFEFTAQTAASFITTTVPARGVVLLVHGLNQRPDSLDALAQALTAIGFHSYRITLSGHEREGVSAFTPEVWERDVIQAYNEARQRYPTLPTFMIGYSLGGLLVTRVLDTHTDIKPAGVILIAPALSLRTLPRLGYILTFLPPVSWRVSNIAPTAYRRFAQTPLFWYRNTLEIYSLTQNLTNPSHLRSIPTTILANPNDELVSFCGLTEWLKQNGMVTAWQLQRVKPTPTTPEIPEHLMIDENSLGALEWRKMLELLHRKLVPAAL
jgi:esterase/lipase